MTQIARLTTWAKIADVQAPQLNNEFDNIINTWNNTDAGLLTWGSLSASTLTVTGASTFKAAITITPTSNQIILGTTRTATLTAPTPASSSRVYTFADLGGDYSVVGTIGTQTVAGAKTFSSPIAITATSAHIVLSTSSNTLTIQANAQATSARTWSVPDVSGNGTFAALEGSQTFSGTKTFSAAPVISALTASTVPYLDAGKVLTSSAVTPTQLGFLDATSSIQTQINTKAPTASPTFTGVVTFAAGSIGSPSINFGDSATGFYKFASNIIGVTNNSVLSAEFRGSSTSDDTLCMPLWLLGGGRASPVVIHSIYSTTGITTAKKIAEQGAGSCLTLVAGNDGTNFFIDLIITGQDGTAPTTIVSKTAKGSPSARTYTATAGGNISVAMASGTYSVRTYSLDIADR